MALTNWDFDTVHSSVGFTIRHLVVSKIRGHFTKWSGNLRFDDANPGNSSVNVKIDAASIDTHEPARDTHLRSGDFFEVEKFPHLTFKSTKVEKTADGLDVTGDLSIRGVSKSVVLAVELGGVMKDPWGKKRAGFSAKTTIDRKDFGITFNQVLDVGGVALGEKVEIAIDIEATEVVAAAETAASATA